MALNGNNLSTAVRAAIAGVSDKSDHAAVWDAIGQAIVTYLVANTVVNVVVATTGTASAQTGTGTGTIS